MTPSDSLIFLLRKQIQHQDDMIALIASFALVGVIAIVLASNITVGDKR